MFIYIYIIIYGAIYYIYIYGHEYFVYYAPYMEVSNNGGTPIAGGFVKENPI